MSYVTYPNNPFPPSSENSGGSGEQYVLPIASDETLGGVKVGSNLTIDESGALSAGAPYSLPIASDETLGGVKVGSNLTIDESGELSAGAPYIPPEYTETPKRIATWSNGVGLYRIVKEYATPLSIPYDTWVDTGVDLTDKTFITAFPIKGVIPVVEMAVGAGGFTGKLAITNQVNAIRTIGGIIVYYTESEE